MYIIFLRNNRLKSFDNSMAAGVSQGTYPPGSKYTANNANALLWVHATLIDSAVLMHELMVQTLSTREKDQYIRDSCRFGCLFGIPRELYPTDWEGFERYNAGMCASGVLRCGDGRSSALNK